MALNHATTLDDDTDAMLAPDPLVTDIEALNRRHAFVMNGGKAMVMNFDHDPNLGETLTFSTQADFRGNHANRRTVVLSDDGTSLAQLAEQWWSHPLRREYAGLVFMPGSPPEIPTVHGRPYYNLFRGWPVKPVPGDCGLFWAHLKDIICAGDEERYRYVRRWLAHAIQKPAEMPETALVLRGGQGAGKGTLVNIYGQLFGIHFQAISQMEQLLGKFNAHMQEAILVFGDEVTWGGNKQSEGALKAMITEPHMLIERKGLDTIRCANYRRFIFASNEDWPIALGKGDRRFLVLDVAETHRADTAYFAALRAQMKAGGLQALMHDLLAEDLRTFDVRTKPQGGQAEADLYVRTLRGIERFWYQFLHGADEATWPQSVSKQGFYDEYVAQCLKGTDPEGLPLFAKKLNKMCPGLRSSAPRKAKSSFGLGVGTSASGGEREQRWEFPSLVEARQGFERYAGQGSALWE